MFSKIYRIKKQLQYNILIFVGCIITIIPLILIFYFYRIPDNYKNYLIDLSGKWKIREGKNDEWTSRNINDDNWAEINLPGGYYNQGFRAINSVLRKKFIIKKNMFNRDLFFIIGGTLGSMGNVYINGHKIGEIGLTINNKKTQGTDYKYGFYINKEYIISSENDFNNENVITLELHHSSLGYDGVQDPRIYIGVADYLKLYYEKNIFINNFFQYGLILSSIFILFIISLLLLTEWKSKDRYKYVSTILFVFSVFFYNLCFSNAFLIYLFNFSFLVKLLKVSIAFVCIATLEFIQYFFLRKINLWGKLNRFICLTVIILFLIFNDFVIIQIIYKYFIYYFFIIIIYMCILSFIYTFIKRSKKYGIIITISITFTAITGIVDLLTNIGIIHFPLLFNITISTYILLSSSIIIVDFININNTNKLLTHKLKKSNMALEMKIEKRTSELKVLNDKLQKLDLLKNEFIANITHDFRSPLTIILNTTDLALRYNSLNNEIKENYNVIYKASLRLKNSIDRLLELAKMDAQGIKLKIKKVELVAFLNRILDFYSSSVLGSNIKIARVLPDKEIEDFYTDNEKLEEIIDNIISNAIKFVNPDRGIITIELVEKINSIIISISDNGIGISKDKLDLIFNRFEQVYDIKNIPYRGTGIGLAFAKQLIGYLKGTIKAESEGEGMGSKFIIELKKGRDIFNENDFSNEPDKQTKPEDKKSLIESDIESKIEKDNIKILFQDLNAENEFNYKKGIILIIDDDKNIRDIIMRYLKNHDYKNFIIAPNGQMGIEAIFKYCPDVIICDYNIPDIKGNEIHNQLLKNPKTKNIPFIFLSAVADERLIVERREKGANAYLKKPIEEKIFLITIEEHLKKYFEHQKIIQLSTIDELTGLNNKNAIIAALKHELAIRKYRDLSLIFLDIDNFKKMNDNHGHYIGDRILEVIGKTIKSSIRNYDIAGRYGGDEFLIILPETNLNKACYVAEVLRKTIQITEVQHEEIKLTAYSSFGISSLKDNADYIEKTLSIKSLKDIYDITGTKDINWEKIENTKMDVADILLKMADEALHRAKQTICNKCKFNSEKLQDFNNNKCSKCGSDDLIIGRNKVVAF